MFKQIFPGLKIQNPLKINDYKLQIAHILRSNGADKVKGKLNSLKYTNKESSDIWLLLYMMRPAQVIKDLPTFKKLQKNSSLSSSQVKEWSKVNSKHIIKLWNWKLSVSPQDAIKQGLKGKDIGDYVKSKEEELFISS